MVDMGMLADMDPMVPPTEADSLGTIIWPENVSVELRLESEDVVTLVIMSWDEAGPGSDGGGIRPCP